MPEWMNIAELADEQPEKRIHVERYEYAAKMLVGKTAIDCSCGMGYGTDIMCRAGVLARGVDIDPEAISEAIMRYPHAPYFIGDIRALDFIPDNALVSFETLEHIADPHAVVNALPATVTEIIASVPIRPTVGWNPWHKSDFTSDSFREMIRGAGFRIVHEMGQMWVDGEDLYLMVHGRR